MQKLILGLLLIIFSNITFAQEVPDYDEISLEKKEDYNANANDAALKAANFLFTTPLDNKNMDRLKSLQYILKWMTGTPDYTFTLDERATKIAKKNDDLLALYMAAMTKYVLENPSEAKDDSKIKLNAVRIIISYAKDKNNQVKFTSGLKKAIEAEEKGQLPAYLGI